MIIRKMTPEDTLQAAQIEALSITPPWSQQAFLDALKQDTLMLVAAEDEEGKLLGYVNMYLAFEEGEITNVATHPAFRGQRIARRLMEETIRRAGEKGVERIVLEVRASNAAAIHLYETCGFRELGIRRNFYEQPREDARIMELRIC